MEPVVLDVNRRISAGWRHRSRAEAVPSAPTDRFDHGSDVGGTMSGGISKDRPELGGLFVAGFGEQHPGSAIASLAAALYRRLFRWNAKPHLWPASLPVLSDTVLPGADGEPAHPTLAVPSQLSTGERGARWLLAGSSWANLFDPPGSVGLARWIWKVSTCLLVLQFVIPMRRHWHRARRTASRGTGPWPTGSWPWSTWSS